MPPSSDTGAQVRPEGSGLAEGGRSWFSPARLRDLFLDPRAFFAHRDNIGFTPAVATAAALGACADVMDKLDQKAALVQAGLANEGQRALVGWMTSDWSHYWGCVLGIGLVGAVISWYLRGWWYGLRLRWSGAAEAPFSLARRVGALQQLVAVLPTLAVAMSETLRFASYGDAVERESPWLTLAVPIVFLLWSCWVSYCAATTVFPGARLRAWLWFLVLPLALYGLGSVAAVAALLGRG